MKLILSILVSCFLFACAEEKLVVEEVSESQPKEMRASADGSTTGVLVEKSFVSKGGKETEHKELYLRCSIQDYFIKFCESSVTSEQLQNFINKSITVKMEIKEGLWDQCDEDYEVQSRVGTYISISKLYE